MQYVRSKVFDLFLVGWTLILGMATPIIAVVNNTKLIRNYAYFWASGIAWGIWRIVGLTYRVDGEFPALDAPKLIVSNHQSMWETIIYATLFRDVAFVAKKELGKTPIFGWYLKKMPMILIDRGGGRSAMVELIDKASKAVSEGRSILIFPEGTRVDPDSTKQFHFGVAALYSKLGIPAITIAHNSGCFWNDAYVMKYDGEITIRIIEEISPGLDSKEFLRRVESSINSQKADLRDSLSLDEWRWAHG